MMFVKTLCIYMLSFEEFVEGNPVDENEKKYSNLSHINIQYYLKLRIPMCHRLFSEKYHKIANIFKLIAMIEGILFNLHVVNGIDIIIHNVIWCNYTNTNTNISIIIRILVQTLFFNDI